MRARTAVVLVGLALVLFAAPSEAHRRGRAPGWSVALGWYPGWMPWIGAWQPVPAGIPRAMNLTVVDTDVSPEHARVRLDGELIGIADDFDGYPGYLFLEPGRYTLEFELAGYRTERVEIDAEEGRSYPIDLKLMRDGSRSPAPWWDRPSGPPVARVFGKEPRAGDAPARTQARPDPALRPELRPEPRRPDLRDEDEAEEAREREEERLEEMDAPAPSEPQVEEPRALPRERRRSGAVDLRVRPGNASVWVDGAFLGVADELNRLERGVTVPAGRHQIEVLAPGHRGRTIEIEVREGERRQVVVELEEL